MLVSRVGMSQGLAASLLGELIQYGDFRYYSMPRSPTFVVLVLTCPRTPDHVTRTAP